MEAQRKKKRGKKRKVEQPAAKVCLPAPPLTLWLVAAVKSLHCCYSIVAYTLCRHHRRQKAQQQQLLRQSLLWRTQLKLSRQSLSKPPSVGAQRMGPQHSQRG